MQKNIFNINILSFNRKKIIKKEYLYIPMHIYIFKLNYFIHMQIQPKYPLHIIILYSFILIINNSFFTFVIFNISYFIFTIMFIIIRTIINITIYIFT